LLEREEREMQNNEAKGSLLIRKGFCISIVQVFTRIVSKLAERLFGNFDSKFYFEKLRRDL
jgi:hypothetical protein